MNNLDDQIDPVIALDDDSVMQYLLQNPDFFIRNARSVSACAVQRRTRTGQCQDGQPARTVPQFGIFRPRLDARTTEVVKRMPRCARSPGSRVTRDGKCAGVVGSAAAGAG